VHFVDDVDLVAAARRRVGGVLQQLAHLVDLGVGRGVDLDEVHEAAAVDFLAGAAGAAGWSVMPVSQLSALARMRARVVLPTPRVPVNR
jgi:hypothetical protein